VPMKPMKRTWGRLGAGVVLVLLALCTLRVWNKRDFCQGWATHYAGRAKELRSVATNPALGRDEVKECLIAADIHDLISKKYAAVASRPWRRYPGYPLVTSEEQQTAAGRY